MSILQIKTVVGDASFQLSFNNGSKGLNYRNLSYNVFYVFYNRV